MSLFRNKRIMLYEMFYNFPQFCSINPMQSIFFLMNSMVYVNTGLLKAFIREEVE